jgi:CubicO group peptidase (beta-lactamase class C family)
LRVTAKPFRAVARTSGVSGWEDPITLEDFYDPERSAARLAAQAPWWEPGSASGYHAADYGQLVGELVRRTDGRALKAFVAEEIAVPLGADFQIGAAEEDWGRIAPVVAPPPLPIDVDAIPADSPLYKTLFVLPFAADSANTPAWRRADLGAVNGHGNAASVARILSAITLGGAAHGVRLLSPAPIERIFDEQSAGVDLVLGLPLRFGVGFGLPQLDSLSYSPDERICFWGGWGGSMIIMDLERRMTIAYMMNKMGAGLIGSENATLYCDAIYGVVGAKAALS